MSKTLIFVLMCAVIPTVAAYNLDILETNPSPIQAGAWADVTVQLVSTAARDDIRNDVVLSVESTGDFRPVSGQEYLFQRFGGGERITRTFRIFFGEDLPAGNVPLTFLVEDGGVTFNLEQEVFIKGSINTPELYIGSIRTTPKELLRDTKNNKMVLTLQNLGDKTAELVTVEVIELDCCIEESFTYSLRDSLASLEGGEEADLEFTFDVLETAKDIITPSLLVRYRTENELTNSFQTVTENIAFEIPLTKAPDIRITKVEPLSSIETRSQENELLVQVTNVGEEEGESVRLRLYPDPSYPYDFERTNYFITSKLEPGENASVIVKFDVLDFATISSYPIIAEVESIVGESRYVQDDEINIRVTGIGTNQAVVFRTGFLIAAGAIAVVLGLLVVLRRIRRKR